jgi:tetratricopeptide (TPR) repeat protein
MKIGRLRLRFVWGTAKVPADWRLRLAGYYEHLRGYPRSGLAFNVRGLLGLAFGLAGLAYMGGATALYLWLDRQPHNFVTYTDTLLLPLRIDEVRAKRGQGYIEAGIEDLKAQRWAQGEMRLRVGLRRYPQDTRARLHLAEFYQVSQRRALALQVLREGIDPRRDYPGRRYLTTYFSYLSLGQEQAAIITACDRYLADAAGLPARDAAWLREQKIAAMITLGQAEAALALLADRGDSPQLNELHVLALLKLGRGEEAIAALADWRARTKGTVQILRLQVRAFREAGRPAEMEAALEALRQLAPAVPAPYAYATVQRAMAGDEAGARAGLGDYFLRFGANGQAVQALAAPLAEIGAQALLEELIERQAAQGHDTRTSILQLAQLQIKNGDWPAASRSISRARELKPADPLPGQEMFEVLIAVLTDPVEGERLRLLEVIGRRPLPLAGYVTLITPLMQAGRHQTALDLAAQAERHYGGSAALAQVRTDAQAALAMVRRPETAFTLPGAAAAGFMGEADFYAQLDGAAAAGEWERAAGLLREAQAARPAWLNSRHPDWQTRQLRVALENGNTPEVLLAVRQLLDGSLARSQLVVDYANELRAQNRTEAAILLLREIQRRTPAHALSRRLLEAWENKPEPAVTPGGS